MSSSCIQTVKIYYQLYLDILLSSAACEKKTSMKISYWEKKKKISNKEKYSWEISVLFVLLLFSLENGHLKCLAKSYVQTKLRGLAR